MTYDLPKAIEIAKKAHDGQYRKYNNKSYYWEHPHKVMKIILKGSSPNISDLMTAVLHDVIEDSNYTIEDLRKEGIPEDVLTAVYLLTHKKGVKYNDYLIALKHNEIARRVKIADMLNNMTDFFAYNHEEKMKKYLDGIQFLIIK